MLYLMTIMTSRHTDILYLVSKERKWYYNNYTYGQVGESEESII